MLAKKVNHRINPFTAAAAYTTIAGEVHAIPGSGTYRIRLNEVPDENYTHATSGSPLYIRTPGGVVFAEVATSPGLNEFRVDYEYKTGWVEFNSANADDIILCDYRGTGSPTTAEVINSLQYGIPMIAEFLFGDGSDGDATISSSTALSPASGENVVFKQYDNLTINASQTLSLDSSGRGMILCVAGVLTMGASAQISVAGNGGSGGSGTSTAGNDGGAGAWGGGGGGGGVGGIGGAGGGNDVLFGPGQGVGGAGGLSNNGAGGHGAATVWSKEHFWRTLQNFMIYGAGGGAGGGNIGHLGRPGGAGAGFLIVYCNILDISSGARFNASGEDGVDSVNTDAGGGGGGAGGAVLVAAQRIVGATEATLESTFIDSSGGSGGSSGGTGSGVGGDGSDGPKRGVELYEYNVR